MGGPWYLLLGLLTVIAGVIAYLWESRRLAGDVAVRSGRV